MDNKKGYDGFRGGATSYLYKSAI